MILRSLAGRNLLFSPAAQAIYEVDDFSADVWRSLAAGATAETIVDELTRGGATEEESRDAVAAALAALDKLPAAAAQAGELGSPARDRMASIYFNIAGSLAQFVASEGLAQVARTFLSHLLCSPGNSDILLIARLDSEEVHFLRPGGEAWTCHISEFLPTLKAELVADVLATARYEVAFHAAGLVHDDQLVLLVGSPGAGKSTLALALAEGGWLLDGDDVILSGADGSGRGLAFPVAAKAGAWQLIGNNWPRVVLSEEHRRPDGLAVRFIVPEHFAEPKPRPIASVILLNRLDAADPRLEAIDPVVALSALIGEADNQSHRLTSTGFVSMVDVLERARCFRVTYSDAAQAAEVVRRAVS